MRAGRNCKWTLREDRLLLSLYWTGESKDTITIPTHSAKSAARGRLNYLQLNLTHDVYNAFQHVHKHSELTARQENL